MSWQVPRHCVSVSGDPVREKRNGDGRRHQDWRPANCKIVAAATKDSFGAENLQCLYVQLVCTFSYTSANSFNFQTHKIAKETLYTKPVTFCLLLVIMVLLSSVAYNSAMVLPWHSKWGKIINDVDSILKDRELHGLSCHVRSYCRTALVPVKADTHLLLDACVKRWLTRQKTTDTECCWTVLLMSVSGI